MGRVFIEGKLLLCVEKRYMVIIMKWKGMEILGYK